MRWFGHIKNGPEMDYASELEEATVAADPQTLRELAAFLLKAADLMDLHGQDFEHEHFEKHSRRPKGECRFVVNREIGDKG